MAGGAARKENLRLSSWTYEKKNKRITKSLIIVAEVNLKELLHIYKKNGLR